MDSLFFWIIILLAILLLVRGLGSKPAGKQGPVQEPRRAGLRMEVTGSRDSKYKALIRQNFDYDLPAGWELAESEIDLAGITHHKEYARAFIRGADQAIRLEPDPKNPHDRNAVKIIGIFARRAGGAKQEAHIGYVPSDYAERLHDAGLTNRVRGQLQNVYEGDNGYLGIRFDLLCLAEDLPRWEDF